jgi:hypothetical protein
MMGDQQSCVLCREKLQLLQYVIETIKTVAFLCPRRVLKGAPEIGCIRYCLRIFTGWRMLWTPFRHCHFCFLHRPLCAYTRKASLVLASLASSYSHEEADMTRCRWVQAGRTRSYFWHDRLFLPTEEGQKRHARNFC